MSYTRNFQHIVFRTKCSELTIPEDQKRILLTFLFEYCKRARVYLRRVNAYRNHVHMLVEIPPKYSVSQIMGYLKGKSSLIIFDRHANLKYKYGNRKFWCRGYYVDTVGRNEQKIKEYIQNQLKEDYYNDQISIKEYYDPFTGSSE